VGLVGLVGERAISRNKSLNKSANAHQMKILSQKRGCQAIGAWLADRAYYHIQLGSTTDNPN
jgi:hypothetical protein